MIIKEIPEFVSFILIRCDQFHSGFQKKIKCFHFQSNKKQCEKKFMPSCKDNEEEWKCMYCQQARNENHEMRNCEETVITLTHVEKSPTSRTGRKMKKIKTRYNLAAPGIHLILKLSDTNPRKTCVS